MEPVIRPQELPYEDLKWYLKVPVIGLLLAFIALAAIQLWPDNGSINITRDDYNTALAR
ncbi:MAG: hypothetical protein ACJ78Q_08190 [Chloroflexia bacterium]